MRSQLRAASEPNHAGVIETTPDRRVTFDESEARRGGRRSGPPSGATSRASSAASEVRHNETRAAMRELQEQVLQQQRELSDQAGGEELRALY